jgi:hypothetical protein
VEEGDSSHIPHVNMKCPNGQAMVSACITALLTFKLVVRYSSVCIAHNQHVGILKIISLYIQSCKQKSHV